MTILGCGPSWGVPAIGPFWGRCDPGDPRNRRRRVSLLIETQEKVILIDTSPDLREQLLDASVKRLDAVLLTHAHADHLHGIDDLRAINRLMKAAIPLYLDRATLAVLEQRFAYVLKPPSPDEAYYRPTLIPHPIEGPFTIGGTLILPFTQDHGFGSTLGYRIGAMAYSTDVVGLDEHAFSVLAGIELWILECMRREPHPTHSHLARSLAWIARVGPRRAVLTHMDGSLDYAEFSRELPPGVEPGRDGLVIDLAEA